MKKKLLILLATGLWIYAGAQTNNAHAKQEASKPVHFSKLVHHTRTGDNNAVTPGQPFYSQSIDNKDGQRRGGDLRPQGAGPVKVGGSFNVNSIRTAPCTQVTYNAALGGIFYTHRADFSKSFGTGAYELSYSMDGGATWDSSFVVYGNKPGRYPNGLIYNPAGNTNVKKAYWAYSGPYNTAPASPTSYDKYTDWDSTLFGSARLDSTSIVQGYKGNGDPGVLVEEANGYMSIGDDSVVHVVGNGYTYTPGLLTSATTGALQMYLGTALSTGTFSGGKYNWTQTLIRPHLMANSDSSNAEFDTIAQVLGEPGTAWSQDGQTGYVVIFGNLDSIDAISGRNLNFVSFQPLVWITQNGGTTWTMMTPHNFRNDTALTKYLHPTLDSANVTLPLWRLFGGIQDDWDDYDLVVDKNKNLHIFGVVQGSGIANHDSSAFLSYFTHFSYLYDVSTTPTGTWTSRYIDSVHIPSVIANITNQWGDITSGTYAGSVAFGARVQASRTLDGSKVFCTWLDDVISYTSGQDSILYPDIFGQAIDVTSGFKTKVKQFTVSADNWFLDVADYPIVAGASPATYTIPCVKVLTPYVAGTGNSGSYPVEYVYTNAVMWADTNFTDAVPTIIANQFSVSPNYPNPYNGLTSFNLTLVKEGTVSVDVFNMVGQKLWTRDAEKMAPGQHVITLNSAGYNAGVYFYRVTVNGQSLTQKMIVE